MPAGAPGAQGPAAQDQGQDGGVGQVAPPWLPAVNMGEVLRRIEAMALDQPEGEEPPGAATGSGREEEDLDAAYGTAALRAPLLLPDERRPRLGTALAVGFAADATAVGGGGVAAAAAAGGIPPVPLEQDVHLAALSYGTVTARWGCAEAAASAARCLLEPHGQPGTSVLLLGQCRQALLATAAAAALAAGQQCVLLRGRNMQAAREQVEAALRQVREKGACDRCLSH